MPESESSSDDSSSDEKPVAKPKHAVPAKKEKAAVVEVSDLSDSDDDSEQDLAALLASKNKQ